MLLLLVTFKNDFLWITTVNTCKKNFYILATRIHGVHMSSQPAAAWCRCNRDQSQWNHDGSSPQQAAVQPGWERRRGLPQVSKNAYEQQPSVQDIVRLAMDMSMSTQHVPSLLGELARFPVHQSNYCILVNSCLRRVVGELPGHHIRLWHQRCSLYSQQSSAATVCMLIDVTCTPISTEFGLLL